MGLFRRNGGRDKPGPAPYTPPTLPEYTYLDPVDMQPIGADAVLDGSRTGVCYEGNDWTRSFTRGAPAFLDDPDATGLFNNLDIVPEPVTYPPALTMSATDVMLIGYRSFITAERRFFTDEALRPERRYHWLKHFRAASRQLNEETGFEAGTYRDTFFLPRNLSVAERVDERTVALVSQEPFNYGSFLFRVLPKVAGLERLGCSADKILVHTPYASFRDALVLAGIDESRLVQHDVAKSYRFRHVIVPGLRNPHALLDDESRALFARMREETGYSYDGSRIYVARNRPGQILDEKWNGRVLLNEAALIERLTALGFRIVVPGELSMAEQIRTFASAGMVVGGSGSALFNTVFCRPGTRVIDIESERHWIHAHLCLLSSAGLDFGIFVGKADSGQTGTDHRRWTVNVEALADRIQAFA